MYAHLGAALEVLLSLVAHSHDLDSQAQGGELLVALLCLHGVGRMGPRSACSAVRMEPKAAIGRNVTFLGLEFPVPVKQLYCTAPAHRKVAA